MFCVDRSLVGPDTAGVGKTRLRFPTGGEAKRLMYKTGSRVDQKRPRSAHHPPSLTPHYYETPMELAMVCLGRCHMRTSPFCLPTDIQPFCDRTRIPFLAGRFISVLHSHLFSCLSDVGSYRMVIACTCTSAIALHPLQYTMWLEVVIDFGGIVLAYKVGHPHCQHIAQTGWRRHHCFFRGCKQLSCLTEIRGNV